MMIKLCFPVLSSNSERPYEVGDNDYFSDYKTCENFMLDLGYYDDEFYVYDADIEDTELDDINIVS